MKCPKCSSEEVNVQMTSSQQYSKGHGCLLTLLFGAYYWTYWFLKWLFIYALFFVYLLIKWILIVPVHLVRSLISKKPFRLQDIHRPKWLSRMMRKKGKMYNEKHSHAVCQTCGYHWTLHKQF